MTETITSTATAPRTATPSSTTVLLTCGAAAGPLYLVVSYAQAVSREGFDLTRHPFSLLSNGELGWIQIANFVVSGALLLAGAVGTRRVLHSQRAGTWGPRLVGAAGIGMICGGVFVADPSFGFPIGAPAGAPEVLTWHSVAHGVAAGVGFLSLIAACFVSARRYFGRGERNWAVYSGATGGLFLAAVVVSPLATGQAWANVLLLAAVSLTLVWTSATAARLASDQR
jgi:hypothetical protein